MRRIAATVLGVIGIGAIGLAQVTEVRLLEQQRAESVRSGKGLDQYYSPDYLGITRSGTVTDRQAVASLEPDPKYTVEDDFNVRLSGNGAITTGTQHVGDGRVAVRFLRVWVKLADGWKLVACQTTTIALQADYTASASTETRLASPSPGRRADRAVLVADQSLLQAEAENEEAQARALKTNDSQFVERTGSVTVVPGGPRAVRLETEAAAYDRVQSYGDIAVVQGRLLWTDINGYSPGVLRFTRVWIKQGADWKVAAEQRTSITN